MYTIRGNYIDRLFSNDVPFTTREGGIVQVSYAAGLDLRFFHS